MSAKQRCVHRSKTCYQTLKHFNNVISTCCENVVEVLESLTTSYIVAVHFIGGVSGENH